MKDYLTQYREKLISSEQIAERIQSGQYIATDNMLAAPIAILNAIGARAEKNLVKGLSVYTTLDVYDYPCFKPEIAENFRGISWFCGASARKGVNSGLGDVLPGYYRDFPRIVRDSRPVDVFCAAVGPMDKHGYFTMGTVGSQSEACIEKAKYIYLEINENMPRVSSAPLIHISQVDGICENTIPLRGLPQVELDEKSKLIGQLIAEEIPNGATLQLGIGAIPDAVGTALMTKRNLGIHTEMFTDSMVGLLECGAVDNSVKPIHRGRTVCTFAYGSQRLYDYIDDNPSVLMLPVDYVNDVQRIASHPNFMSINSALEVDFFGQTAAESIGTFQISGTGGQVDYVRGAVESKGGKSFIAFHSTAKDDTVSRIVPMLTQGAIVTTSKNDIDNIVTEYGIARLRGRTLSERTKALIAIAHPKFREELTFAAKKQNILI